ncbi:MAG: hypothetical protein LBK55_09690 [Azoarcus sp.]|nr:hypothetical protein [Azoarcus sp.]
MIDRFLLLPRRRHGGRHAGCACPAGLQPKAIGVSIAVIGHWFRARRARCAELAYIWARGSILNTGMLWTIIPSLAAAIPCWFSGALHECAFLSFTVGGKLMKRFILSMAVLSFLAFTVMPLANAAARSRPMQRFDNEIILHSATPDAAEKVHEAILSAAKQYKWRVVSDNGDTLRLSYTVRSHRVEIDVRILGAAVNVDYVDSINMGYSARGGADDTNENAVIHPSYGKWVNNFLIAARAAAN